MTNNEFLEFAKDLVGEYVEMQVHTDLTDFSWEKDVYIVWSCYILGNMKAMVSTTISDGMYYEVTYNNAKNEVYLDAYKKSENRCINIKG